MGCDTLLAKGAAALLALLATACLINSGRQEMEAVMLPSFLRGDARWQKSTMKIFGLSKPKVRTWSTMEAFPDLPPSMEWRPGAPQKEYYVFRNIQIVDGGVRFYYRPDSPPPVDAPTSYTFWSRTPKDVNISISYRQLPQGRWDPLDSCIDRHHKPAVTFDVTDLNIWHFLNEISLPSFHMVMDHGFMPEHVTRSLQCLEEADANTAHTCKLDLRAPSNSAVTYIAMRRPGQILPSGGGDRLVPDALESPRAHLLTHISTDLQYWDDLEGHCFDTLVLGHTEITDIAIGNMPEEGNADRSRVLLEYQKYAFLSAMTDRLAAARNYTSQAEAQRLIAAAVSFRERRAAAKRPQILLASRRPPTKRATLNEEEMCQFIRDRWDADLVLSEFKGPLLDSIAAVRQASVFMGFHGAGFCNTFFLPPGWVTMLQMFPWGWLREDGRVEREPMFKNVAIALNQSYYHWLSPDMANGLLQADQCADGVRTPPNSSLWPGHHAIMYQDTFVDLKSLEPVLDEAFASAGISRREGGSKKGGSGGGGGSNKSRKAAGPAPC